MRTRRITSVLLLIAIATVVAWAMSKPTRPSISIAVTGYTFYQRGPLAHLVITNDGPTPVRWRVTGFEDGWLEVKTATGWERQRELGGNQWLYPHTVLAPGQTVKIGVGIRGNLPWRIAYTLRPASARERAVLRLRGPWRDWMATMCGRVLSDEPGPAFEFVTTAHDGSNYVVAHETPEIKEAAETDVYLAPKDPGALPAF